MTFHEYCHSKKIDAEKFRLGSPDVYAQWQKMFDQLSPASFTEQKKFLINKVRREYLLETKTLDKSVEG